LKGIGHRRKTKTIFVGNVPVGGNAPLVVQSMTCTDTRDVRATVAQIRELEEAGCELIRVAVPDAEAAEALGTIKKRISIPLIADIHFNFRLALEAIRQGADGIRINPGNMKREGLRRIVAAAASAGAAIRIGINAGSLEKDILRKHGRPTAAALVESALRSLAFFEEMGAKSLKLSIKSSDVPTMIESYRLVAKRTRWPLHLGVTEAGTLLHAAVKSSIGIGVLLAEGIGDTLRVSVTGHPREEIRLAYEILGALRLRRRGPEIISCPTCGRCEIDLFRLAEEVESRLTGLKEPLKIALMGCVVNGPGEAAEADIGIAGGKGQGLLFRCGKAVRKVREADFADELLREISRMTKDEKEM